MELTISESIGRFISTCKIIATITMYCRLRAGMSISVQVFTYWIPKTTPTGYTAAVCSHEFYRNHCQVIRSIKLQRVCKNRCKCFKGCNNSRSYNSHPYFLSCNLKVYQRWGYFRCCQRIISTVPKDLLKNRMLCKLYYQIIRL